jgi:filamentous hemagglutinin
MVGCNPRSGLHRLLDSTASRMINPRSLLGRQGSTEMSGSKVKRFTKNMRTNGYGRYPSIEAANVEGRLFIVDGHHRSAAARAGLREVPVDVQNVNQKEENQLMREAIEAISH